MVNQFILMVFFINDGDLIGRVLPSITNIYAISNGLGVEFSLSLENNVVNSFVLLANQDDIFIITNI